MSEGTFSHEVTHISTYLSYLELQKCCNLYKNINPLFLGKERYKLTLICHLLTLVLGVFEVNQFLIHTMLIF